MKFGKSPMGKTVHKVTGERGRYSEIFTDEGKRKALPMRGGAHAYYLNADVIIEFDNEEDAMMFILSF